MDDLINRRLQVEMREKASDDVWLVRFTHWPEIFGATGLSRAENPVRVKRQVSF